MSKDSPNKETERMVSMEAYKKGLLVWLELQCRKEIIKNSKDTSDVYIGRMNAFEEFIAHIKGNLRNKNYKP